MRTEPRSALYELTLARFREFWREPGAIFWTFGFPILLTIALGIAFRSQPPPKAAVGVRAGPGADELVRALAASPQLEAQALPAEQAEEALRRGQVLVWVEPGEGGALRYRYDPSRPEAGAARLLADDALQRAAGRRDVRAVSDETYAAPGARYVDWLIPGLIGMQLMSGSLWGLSYAIVQTRQRKLLKRLLATPMRRGDYLLSFLISRLAFVVVEVPVLLLFARLAFGVDVHGSLGAVALVSLLGAVAFSGVGLLCASRAENTETANGLVNLVTLPMFVVSGVFFSSARFPEVVQPLIKLLPLTALNDALRAVINQGADLASQAMPLGVLAVWSVVTFFLALRIFRWV